MSMNLDNVLWLGGLFAEATVVALLFYRRIWRTLPVFCVYCIWDILTNASTYFIDAYFPKVFFSAYEVQSVVDAILELAVLTELAWSVLRPVRSSLPRTALVVVTGLLVAAGAIIWPFAALPSLQQVARQGLLFEQLETTVSILRILFFLLLAAGSQLLSIGWRDRELQVATGLGFYSIVSVTVAMIGAHETTATQLYQLNKFAVAGFVCSLCYWLVSFAQREAERREFTPQMQSFLLAVAGAAHSGRTALTQSRAKKDDKQDRD